MTQVLEARHDAPVGSTPDASERAIGTICDRFADRVDRDTLEVVVRAEFARWERCRVREYVPLLVERTIRERLQRAAAIAAP
jgi:hypothetical protein